MADLKGNLTEYKSRRKKLNVMKLVVVLIAVGVILYFAISAVKIVNLTIEKNRVETENERLRNQKEDLEKSKEVPDGMTFKITDDPRIISSGKKGRKGQPKGIGFFI